MAVALGISRVIIHKYSSILSAYGLALAEVVNEAQKPTSGEYAAFKGSTGSKEFQALIDKASEQLFQQGFSKEQIRYELFLNMRYEGSDTTLMILKPTEDGDFGRAFVERHRREFSFTLDRPILVDDIRVRAIASSKAAEEKSPLQQLKEAKQLSAPGKPVQHSEVYFDAGTGYASTPIYLLHDLGANVQVQGPAVIIDNIQTIVVAPHAVAYVLQSCVVIDIEHKASKDSKDNSEHVDPIRLTIFGYRLVYCPLCLSSLILIDNDGFLDSCQWPNRWVVLFKRLLCRLISRSGLIFPVPCFHQMVDL